MRSNSLAQRNPTPYSVSNKTTMYNRPPTRNSSIPSQFRQTNTRLNENHGVRPKKCPNCGLSFSPNNYNTHFRSCYRFNPQKNYDLKIKSNKQKFRIKKVAGRKDEGVVRGVVKAEGEKVESKKELVEIVREQEKVQISEQQEFQMNSPQFLRREKDEEIARDSNGNQIKNVQEIQDIKDIIEEEETGRPRRHSNRPPTPYPMGNSGRQNQFPALLRPETQVRFQFQQRVPQRVASPSSSSSEEEPSLLPTASHNQRQPVQNPQPVSSPLQHMPIPPPPTDPLQQVIQQISINSITSLIQRLQFLRENEAVQQRLRNLVNYINVINLMLSSGGIPQGSYQTIKNGLQFLVGELTHILSVIVSARMGMMVILFNNFQNQQAVREGFSQAEIDDIFPPEITTNKNEMCSICMGDYVKFERTITLKCSHEFHVGCITEWLLKKEKCPICRMKQR